MDPIIAQAARVVHEARRVLGFPGQPAPFGTPKLTPAQPAQPAKSMQPPKAQFKSFGDPSDPSGTYGKGPLSGGPTPSDESRPGGGISGGGGARSPGVGPTAGGSDRSSTGGTGGYGGSN